MFPLTYSLPLAKCKHLKWTFLLKGFAPSFPICISLNWEFWLEKTKEKISNLVITEAAREKDLSYSFPFRFAPCVPLKFRVVSSSFCITWWAQHENVHPTDFIMSPVKNTWQDTISSARFLSSACAGCLWLAASQGCHCQASGLRWGCILPFPGACCDWVHVRLHPKPKTSDEKRIQRNWDMFFLTT